jgi:hypothetical protein
MKIPLLVGRQFSEGDDERSPKVAILNRTLARIMWPDRSAVGERLTFQGQTIEVVGVVRDIKGRNLFESAGDPTTGWQNRKVAAGTTSRRPPAGATTKGHGRPRSLTTPR